MSVCWSVGLFASFSLNSRSILRGCEMCAATHCNALQHTATHCICVNTRLFSHKETYICSTLQHTATHCNTLQHNAHKEFGFVICVNKKKFLFLSYVSTRDPFSQKISTSAAHCSTLQHAATHYKHGNILKHTAAQHNPFSQKRCTQMPKNQRALTSHFRISFPRRRGMSDSRRTAQVFWRVRGSFSIYLGFFWNV